MATTSSPYFASYADLQTGNNDYLDYQPRYHILACYMSTKCIASYRNSTKPVHVLFTLIFVFSSINCKRGVTSHHLPCLQSHLFVVGDTTYQMPLFIGRHHNSPYTGNSTSPYMNSWELHDHERKRKAQFPFSIRTCSQFSSASDASKLQQKIHTPELLDALYKNLCAHLDDSSQLCHIFTLHPPMMISMICSVSQLRHLYNHQRSPTPCRRQPVALLQVVPSNNHHPLPRLR